MTWDYAELSKAAKEAGGPELLVDLLVESGKDTGHKEMLPLLGIAVGIGVLADAGINKLVKYFRNKKKIAPEDVELAKSELIKGIKEYDVGQTEEICYEEAEENGEVQEGGKGDE